MRTNGSDVLVAALENEGVQRIFALPGEENLAVVESLRSPDAEVIGDIGATVTALADALRVLAVCGDGGFMTFGYPDFVRYANSYGAHGHRVASTAELISTLETAFKAGGVHLVAVPIDYSENMRALVEEFGNRSIG